MNHVLVIDDDAETRKALTSALEGAGYSVSEAADGLEGLSRYRVNPADLVITDMAMPNQDGWETIRQLKQFSPAVSIVAMTTGGLGSAGVLMGATVLGAAAVFEKPFQADHVLSIVRSILLERAGATRHQ